MDILLILNINYKVGDLMQYHVYPSQMLKLQQRNEIYYILNHCDNEFVPSLSSRKSFNQTSFDECNEKSSLQDYFSSLFADDKKFVICYNDNKIVGFISYGIISPLSEYKNLYYISTVCVLVNYRNQGVASSMYKTLFEDTKILNKRGIYTRTWSTNVSHIRLLYSLGFAKIKELVNDRGRGISTIYFAVFF